VQRVTPWVDHKASMTGVYVSRYKRVYGMAEVPAGTLRDKPAAEPTAKQLDSFLRTGMPIFMA